MDQQLIAEILKVNTIMRNVNRFRMQIESQSPTAQNAANVQMQKRKPAAANANAMASLKIKNGTLTMKMI
jgi:hypothetical protein